MTAPKPLPALAIHGGAGTIRAGGDATEEQRYHAALAEILRAGERLLAAGASALEIVTEAVVLLEDCPLFNAGHGAVFTEAGTHELDAAIMDGRDLRAGAVAGLKRTRHPVRAARAVMERSDHVFLGGEGGDAFAARQGLEQVENGFFATEARHAQWRRAVAAGGKAMLDHDAASAAAAAGDPAPLDADRKLGTVGAVAIDRDGNLAAASSTGGMTNKMTGRIGDTPIIGAGCYANNRTLAAAATGTGEAFIRAVALHDISARMDYLGESLAASCEHVVMTSLPAVGGRGGLVAIDRAGNILLPFNTEGMYRGHVRAGEAPQTAIFR
jgi:beta-aspartyl-peptidase (threonine type)